MKAYILFIILLLSGTLYLHANENQNDTIKSIIEIPQAYTYSPDSLAHFISNHYHTDDDKLLAIYKWIIHNMSYNVFTTFQSRNEVTSEHDEVCKALHTREGICRQIALLFQHVANKMNIPSYTIFGYTKSNNTISSTLHAWCIAKTNEQWYCYDPTFDMGQIKDDRFIRNEAMNYFRMSPEQFIQNHIPFDPIWQLLPSPVTFDAFDNGTEHTDQNTIHFNDSILNYSNQSEIEQIRHSMQRIESNGTPNRLVVYYLDLLHANMNVNVINSMIRTYKHAQKLQNEADDKRRLLVRCIKNGFKKMNDQQIKEMVDQCNALIDQSEQELASIQEIPDKYMDSFTGLKDAIDQTKTYIQEINDICSKYLSKKKSKRKEYIQKYTY